jgi:sarcosine oxidase subunit delta
MHGCGRFFNAARDTVSDKFLTTYKAGEPKPDLDATPATSATVETYEATEGDAR